MLFKYDNPFKNKAFLKLSTQMFRASSLSKNLPYNNNELTLIQHAFRF